MSWVYRPYFHEYRSRSQYQNKDDSRAVGNISRPIDPLSKNLKMPDTINEGENSKSFNFKCSFCPFQCRLKKNLKIHLRVHTGEKPFVCPNCKTGFRQKSHLNSHFKKKFRCSAQPFALMNYSSQ